MGMLLPQNFYFLTTLFKYFFFIIFYSSSLSFCLSLFLKSLPNCLLKIFYVKFAEVIAQPPLELDESQQNVLSYLMVAAALVGSIASGFVNEFKSSRFTLITADVVNAVGCLLNSVEPVPSLQCVGQILICTGSGLSIMTIPLYIREGSAAQLRDGVIMFSGFVMTLGPTFHFLLKLVSREFAAISTIVLPLVHLSLVLYLDENPLTLLKQNNELSALKGIEKRYLSHEVRPIYSQLRDIASRAKQSTSTTLIFRLKKEITNKNFLTTLIGGLIPTCVSQILGHQLVMYKLKSYFEMSQLPKEYELIIGLFVSFLSFTVELYVIKIFSYKAIMLWSLFFITVDLFALIIAFQVIDESSGGIFILFLLEAFIIAYTVGLSAIPELFMVIYFGEWLLCFRAALASFLNKLINGITMIVLFAVGDKRNKTNAFKSYMFLSAVGFVLVFILVPEDKKRKKRRKGLRGARKGRKIIFNFTRVNLCFGQSTETEPPNPIDPIMDGVNTTNGSSSMSRTF